jgi:translation initiation factor IF-3
VRLIGDDGEKVGVVPIEEALRRARESGLDLVEVAPEAQPPVCRIADYRKMLYEKQRKQKEARKHQRGTETKEVKLRPNIAGHDYATKLNHVREFLKTGHKVKITLVFRQREMRRYDLGMDVVQRIVEDVKDIATKEAPGRGQQRAIVLLLVPSREVMLEVERQHRLLEQELGAEGHGKGHPKADEAEAKEEEAPPASATTAEAAVDQGAV